jgi:hypothetical protein
MAHPSDWSPHAHSDTAILPLDIAQLHHPRPLVDLPLLRHAAARIETECRLKAGGK